MIKIAISRCCELQSAEANVIKSLIVNTESLVCIFHQLMNAQSWVVRLNDSVTDFWRWHHRKSVHNSVGKFFTNFRNQQSSHATASATTKRVSQLKALQAIATFRLLSHNIHHRINELSAFGVVALCPIVAGTRLSKDIIIGSKESPVRRHLQTLNRSRLKIDQNRTWNIFITSRRLIVINVYALQLKIGIALVIACRIDAVLFGNYFPKLEVGNLNFI